MEKIYDMEKFVRMHQVDYQRALAEIKNGHKESHWIWYIFPQMIGLGYSEPSMKYGIHDLDEARAFLNHPYLGKNLEEICGALLELETNSPWQVFKTDDKKLKSSMTLFMLATDENSIFQKVLDKFFGGKIDMRTVDMLKNL